jgi:N-acetylhexosamine 1-kinase
MEINKIINEFDLGSDLKEYRPIGNGHINTTLLFITKDEKKYILQEINTVAFKDVDGLMSNIYGVTNFLREKGQRSLEVIKTKNNKLYFKDNNRYYRVYKFIDSAVTYEGIDDLNIVYKASKAFGKLHKTLKEYDASLLVETIPHFHDTEKRYQDFLNAVKEDKYNRVNTCLKEIEFFKKHSNEYSKVVNGIKEGKIANAVTHNDPKINNVMFDKNSGELVAVIDLDTIMPGSYLYDFGDAIRSLFTGEYEDSRDLSKINVRYDVFEVYVKGYLEEMKNSLTECEKSLLSFSVFLLASEIAMRFLEDYLKGDIYFHTDYPEHNLIRARTQIKLADEIYNSFDKLDTIVSKYL